MRYFSEKLFDSFPLIRCITDCGAMHYHKFWEIAVFLNGKSYNHEPNGKKTKCLPCYCMIFRPNIDSHYVEHDSANLAHIDIYISNEKMQNICNILKTEDGTPFIDLLMNSSEIPQFYLSEQTVALIQDSLCLHDFWPVTTIIDNDHSSIILLILSEYYSNLKSQPHEQSDLIYQIVNLLKNPDNFTKNLDDILKQVPFSRTHINQEFKKVTNSTLIAYFDQQKIFYASTLLLNTDKTILSISNAVGFSTPKSFISQFKKVFNCTPSDYRKNSFTSEKQ